MYRKHPICVLQTFPQHQGLCQPVHTSRPGTAPGVCALQQQTHTGRYQNAKQQRTFCLYRLTLAEQQPVHFETAHSLLFPEREPPLFHINHTSLVTPGKTCKFYQTSRICFLLISHMLSHTQGLRSATAVSLPTLTIAEPAFRACLGLCPPFTQFLLHLFLVKTPELVKKWRHTTKNGSIEIIIWRQMSSAAALLLA